jgi:hypothetical protein
MRRPFTRNAAMSNESPQLAFIEWLSSALEGLCEAIRRDDAREAFSRATPKNLFW